MADKLVLGMPDSRCLWCFRCSTPGFTMCVSYVLFVRCGHCRECQGRGGQLAVAAGLRAHVFGVQAVHLLQLRRFGLVSCACTAVVADGGDCVRCGLGRVADVWSWSVACPQGRLVT